MLIVLIIWSSRTCICYIAFSFSAHFKRNLVFGLFKVNLFRKILKAKNNLEKHKSTYGSKISPHSDEQYFCSL